MHKRSLTAQAVRLTSVTGAGIATAACVSAASAATAGSPAKLGKVTVTGTRIKRTNVETAQPITRISRQQLQKSGYTNLGDFLGRLSFAGSHSNSTGAYTNGQTQVSLRGLGAARNLILVNGKRWFQGLGGGTNLNTISTSVIDHIEILQDGASAVYGSDAIAGVVNVITVKNFNGAEAHAYYGIHNGDGHWDGQIKQYDFTVGSGNDRGNVVFNVTYREQNSVPASSRKLARTAIAGEPAYIEGYSGTPRGRFQLFGPAVSGRTFGQGTCGIYNPKNPGNTLCDLTLARVPAQPSLQNFRNFKQTDLFNLVGNENLVTPLKDVTAYVQGHYDLFDNVTFTTNAAYIREESVFHDVPIPLKIGAKSPKTANGQPNGDPIGVAATNPYNPFGVDLVADSSAPCLAAGNCIGLGTGFRLTSEAPQKIAPRNLDYFHIFAGFNGFVNLFNREIDWDIGFAQNRLQQARLVSGDFNLAHILRALGPVSQCTSPCVPLNLFGGSVYGGAGSITQAQANYLDYENHGITQSNLRDWTANLSSNLYDLPAGPLGLALGWERVDNYGYHKPDASQVEGNNSNIAGNGPATNGRVVRDAEYAELNIPLLADFPGAKNMSIDIANRWTQFKRTGSVGGGSTRRALSTTRPAVSISAINL